ncbi:MAG: MOSC domain-containing protein [Chloroflexi bacterium]|nr:MOSC domain-containing protein [Chloroflexota bacterium]
MKLISVNVGRPRTVIWKGHPVTTGIFKEPVNGQVTLRRLNLAGDKQADLSVHGGPSKAVYVYPAEHYDYWQQELPELNLPWGMFGENLTTQGLLEDAIFIGDRLRVGTAEVMVTEPRMPCYKLALKFGRDDIIKRFLRSGRSGFYLAVLQEGEVAAGDTLELIQRDPHQVTVADIVRLYVKEKNNLELLHRAVQVEALSEGWRDYFHQQIEKLDRGSHRTAVTTQL